MRGRAELIAAFSGAISGLIVLAAVAAADGTERRPRPPTEVTEEGLEENVNLLGGPDGSQPPATTPPVQVAETPSTQTTAPCPTYEEALTMISTAAPNATDEEINSAVDSVFAQYEDCEEFDRALAQARSLSRFAQLDRPQDLEDPVPPRLRPTASTEPPGDGEPPGGGGGPGYTG